MLERFLVVVVVLLFAFAQAGRRITATTATASPAPTTAYYGDLTGRLLNPERGFMNLCPLTTATDISLLRLAGWTDLCYAPILLSSFRTQAIDTNTINVIRTQLGKFPASGMKAIVRILYDDSIGGVDTTLDWIERHLIQLQPVFEDYGHVIAWFQAGIIGAWGEWHSSVNHLDSDANRQAVWDLVVRYFPPLESCAQIQVRRPDYALQLEPSINVTFSNDDGNCTGARRIAHHNDCWLASASDQGTYVYPGMSEAGARNYWTNFLNHVTVGRVWGGESCGTSEYSHCNFTALADAEKMHMTHLNTLFDVNVIGNLTAEGCWETFEKLLGYRIVLRSVTYPATIQQLASVDVTINLMNQGWSSVLYPRPIYLRLFAPNCVEVIGSNVPSPYQPVSELKMLYMTSDAVCLYLRLTAISVSGGFFESTFNHVFIDTDNNPNTGNSGYELMIEAGYGYDERKGGWNEGSVVGSRMIWSSSPASKSTGTNATDNESCVPRNWRYQDGSSVFPASGSTIGVRITSSATNFVVADYIPDSGSSKYTLADFATSIVYEHSIPADQQGDVRKWAPNLEVSITHSFVVPQNATNFPSLDLALWMPDASPLLSSFPAYSIQVANDAVWDSIRAHNTLAQNIPVIRDAATTTTANNEMEIE